MASGAQGSWIDDTTDLPACTVSKFMIYVHYIPGETTSDLDLQIWRPENVVTNEYSLVWSNTVTVTVDTPGGSAFEVNNGNHTEKVSKNAIFNMLNFFKGP